jgi:hypothetical protein
MAINQHLLVRDDLRNLQLDGVEVRGVVGQEGGGFMPAG